jgi:hypothetical protein
MAASAAASALTNNIFYQTGSLKKYIDVNVKGSVSKRIAILKSLKILYGALAYGTTYKQEDYSFKSVS